MTEITMVMVDRPYDHRYEVTLEGHADYNLDGEDIVCASISMITCMLAQHLTELSGDVEYELEPGNSWVRYENMSNTNVVARYAFDMAYTGYSMLADKYPDNVYLVVIDE